MAINKISSNIFIIFLLIFSHASYSDIKTPTIKEYMSDNSGIYDSYIYGLESGLEWASEYYFRKHEVELYCKPGNIKLPASELRKIINKTISSKPGFFEDYENEPLVGLALRNGFIEAFPCR
tara:strand:+ start:191 stop:556 length:366 start_codon:yes stop_codon:yes gene_type:complete